LRESGYYHEQSTKPQTLGYALNDSPAGLAAWIIEKYASFSIANSHVFVLNCRFHTWSDCKGDLESVFTKDELLTNVMLYWVTNTITSSTRFYYELIYGRNDAFNMMSTYVIIIFCPVYFSSLLIFRLKIQTPTGVANFLAELTGGVRIFCENYYNIQHWSLFDKGISFFYSRYSFLIVRWAFCSNGSAAYFSKGHLVIPSSRRK
jgi:hypothetical protein